MRCPPWIGREAAAGLEPSPGRFGANDKFSIHISQFSISSWKALTIRQSRLPPPEPDRDRSPVAARSHRNGYREVQCFTGVGSRCGRERFPVAARSHGNGYREVQCFTGVGSRCGRGPSAVRFRESLVAPGRSGGPWRFVFPPQDLSCSLPSNPMRKRTR